MKYFSRCVISIFYHYHYHLKIVVFESSCLLTLIENDLNSNMFEKQLIFSYYTAENVLQNTLTKVICKIFFISPVAMS